MSESWIEGELRAALDEVYRPAPWLLSSSMTALRHARPRRRFRALAVGALALVLAVSTTAILVAIRAGRAPAERAAPARTSHARLSDPIPQPITRTSAGAQVAWLAVQSPGQQPYLVGVDPSGRAVGRLDQATASAVAAVYGTWRSADGSALLTLGSHQITVYSAADGTVLRTYSLVSGGVVGNAFSPDGHWLAVLAMGSPLQLQVIDLRAGSSRSRPVERDLNARLPGMTCTGSCAVQAEWGMVVFSSDSSHLYTLTDWGGPVRLSAFSVTDRNLDQTATAVDGQQGRRFPSCAGPAMAGKVVGGGHTLAAFCHFDGAVWFLDLDDLTSSGVVQAQQGSPFWLSPIFTPDGQLLYLHQWPSFGDTFQVVDLTSRRLVGPASTPTDTSRGGPFAGLFTNAYAGGVASTVPISPDGLKLYSATHDGVVVLRVPDLKPIGRLAPGFRANEVWVSGDGQTIYVTAEDGRSLAVVRADGSGQKTVALPGAAGFIASEHG